MMSCGVSVVICTHDPRPDYLHRVLDALRAQTIPFNEWELVLVDNASQAALSGNWTLSWHANGRHVREDNLGLIHARAAGIKQSSADLLVFVDDDNLLAADYLECSLRIERRWPQLGAWGGQNFPEFERTPTEGTRTFWTREFALDRWTNSHDDMDATPFGSGMCVRRLVAEYYVDKLKRDPLRRVLGRKGTQLLAGDDIDLALTACDLGFGIGMFTSLKLTHLIPNERLEDSYLLERVEKGIYSDVILRYLRGKDPPRPSRSQRLLGWYELLRESKRNRRLSLARRRGVEAAIKEIDLFQKKQRVAPR